MKCEFCAEEIQDAAILCRYCGAKLEGERWLAPEQNSSNKDSSSGKGSFTIKTAGLFFILAAIFELLAFSSAVPLFGALRGGAVALVYHLVTAAFFLLAGLGLLEMSRRGLKAFYAMTLYYSLERLLYMADSQAIAAHVKQSSEISTVVSLLSGSEVVETVRTASLIMLLCTWFFALYIYYRRDSFR